MKNAKNEKLHINPQVVCILLLSLLLIACVVCIGVLGANITRKVFRAAACRKPKLKFRSSCSRRLPRQ